MRADCGTWPRLLLSVQNGELLPKSQVFNEQLAAGIEKSDIYYVKEPRAL
jgi:hypothetical protein